MKKFISNISTSTAGAVNSAYKQIDKTLDKALVQQEQQTHVGQPAGETKNYVRLPVDSAKKLRWYDKSDVASLTRQHVREKHMLLDTITALKKVMIRAGFTDAALDQEARELIAAAEAVREADHGTEAVLLLAVQAEVETLTAANSLLRASNEQLHEEVQGLHDRLQNLESSSHQASQLIAPIALGVIPISSSPSVEKESSPAREPTSQSQQPPAANITNNVITDVSNDSVPPSDISDAALASVQRGDGNAGANNGLLQPALLLEELAASYAVLQSAVAAAAQAAAETKVQELLLDEVQQQQQQGHHIQQQQHSSNKEAQQQQQQQDSSNTGAHAQQQQQQQQQQDSSNTPAHATAQKLQQQQQQDSSSKEAHAAAQKLQRYQDLIQHLEDRCRSSERSASLSSARVAALEEALAAAQQATAAAQQRSAAAKQQVAQLEGRLRDAEVAAAAAAVAAQAPQVVEQQQQQQSTHLQDQLAAHKAQVIALERRLAAAESREAHLMGQLRTTAAAAADRDEAVAAAAALQQQLAEVSRDMSQLEYHKQRASSLESAKSALEDQLGHLAAQVALLEQRLREVTAGREAATAAAELAAAAAAKAQAAVAQEVAAQLAACGHNRSMWPPAAKREAQALQQQADTLQEQLEHSQVQLQATKQQLQEARQLQATADEAVAKVQEELVQVQHQAEQLVGSLKLELQASQSEAADLSDALQQAQQQLKSHKEMAAVAATHRHNGGVDLRGVNHHHGTIGLVHSASGSSLLSPRRSAGFTSSSQFKWQEQNQVGGGSLYGVADNADAVARSDRQLMTGVDVVYLKNVVLKFLDAVLAGKTAERDALLPAIATVLHCTPVEYAAMRKVLAATAPPATQVLSMFGRLANLTP